jgi:D-arabinose 1-dehydrogenase-like Zn-dependent alcohol dehydrogenase
MSEHNHETIEAPADVLTAEDRAFLTKIGDDKELVIELVDKAQEVCQVCAMLRSHGAVISPGMELVHQKLHQMVEVKITEGVLLRIDVDGQSVLALAGTDVEAIKADVRLKLAEMEMRQVQTAPSSGSVN